MNLSDYVGTPKDWIIGVVFLLFGLIGGYFMTAYFESKERAIAFEKAVSEATLRGNIDGFSAAQLEFERTAPEKLEEKYPTVFQSMREDAREAGRLAGIEEGRKALELELRSQRFGPDYDEGYRVGSQEGYSRGYAEASREGNAAVDRLDAASRDWQAYANAIQSLAAYAQSLGDAPGNREIEDSFIAQAIALTSIAAELKDAHQQQATAFNSIMDDLARALEARNIARMREIARSLAVSSGAKGERFLENEKRVLEAFNKLPRG